MSFNLHICWRPSRLSCLTCRSTDHRQTFISRKGGSCHWSFIQEEICSSTVVSIKVSQELQIIPGWYAEAAEAFDAHYQDNHPNGNCCLSFQNNLKLFFWFFCFWTTHFHCKLIFPQPFCIPLLFRLKMEKLSHKVVTCKCKTIKMTDHT